MNPRLRELAELYVAENLTDPEWTELEGFLRDSEQARLFFLSFIEVHAGLAWEFRGTGETAENGIALPAAQPRHWVLPMAAAFALLLTLAYFFLRPQPQAVPVASVKASLHGQWADGSGVAAGGKLPAGVWELQSGLVELETGKGTILLLEGPASLELRDPLHARLISGNLVVRMPKGENGFVVEMPRLKVTDLGTEFGVSVSPDGESRVQVYDGKVRAESNGSADRKELEAGETIRCSIDGAMTAAMFNEDRFIRTFPPPKPGYQMGGPLYNRSTLDAVNVLPAAAPATIDGDLAEWNRAGEFRTACEPPYAPTYFVEGLMMYDAKHLYLGAHVGDPQPMRSAARPGAEFAGGSVIVRVSTDRSLGWPLKGSTANARSKTPSADSLNHKISTMVLWYDAKSERAQIAVFHGFDFHGKRIDPPGWSGAFRKDADGRGYTLEYAIPWELLNCADDPPQPGDRLAGLWMAHWSDEEGRVCRGQLVDVTNQDPAVSARIAPYVFFQNGPTWGKVNYLPDRR